MIPPAMAERAAAVAERAERGELLLRVAPLVVAEVVWVLQSFYGHDKRRIAEALTALLTARGVDAVDGDTVVSALETMAGSNVDFVDAYLAQVSCATREAVCSFDEDFRRLGVELVSARPRMNHAFYSRPKLRTIVKAADFARGYLQVDRAAVDAVLADVPGISQLLRDDALLLVWLVRMADAVRELPPAVRAMRPTAPWLELKMFENVDPFRSGFFAAYPEGVVSKIVRENVLPLGKAAAQILADIEKHGLPAPSVAPPAVYQFKVSLVGIRPPIWRRLLISNQVTLHKLHMAIQIMGGWWNYHLHLFEIAGTEYGYPDPDGELDHLSSARYKLNALPLMGERASSMSTILGTIGSTRCCWRTSCRPTKRRAIPCAWAASAAFPTRIAVVCTGTARC